MYLSLLKISNFRCFDDSEHIISFNPGLTILVGENDSGKSAIMDAIRIVLGTTDLGWIRIETDDFYKEDISLEISIMCKFSNLSSEEQASFLECLTYEDQEKSKVDVYKRQVYSVERIGSFQIEEGIKPWVIAREPAEANIVKKVRGTNTTLQDYGYKVSTGQLVWNRLKTQIYEEPECGVRPVSYTHLVRMASEMSLRLYGRPLVVTDSGGKDSAVCREIVRRAGIPFEIHHNLTTADAPQTIYYVRDIFHRLELEGITCCVNYPIYKGQRVTMWSLIPMKKFPPTRLQRYCCQICYEKKVIMERNRRKHCYFKIFRL